MTDCCLEEAESKWNATRCGNLMLITFHQEGWESCRILASCDMLAAFSRNLEEAKMLPGSFHTVTNFIKA
eukprot:12919279-Prorocentrum_lima.AAC.1